MVLMKKKIHLINLLNIESRFIRKSAIHPLGFILKGVIFVINKQRNLLKNKKKVDVYNGDTISQSSWRYKGEIKNFLPHGKGKITSKEELFFEGDFVEGKANGKGVEKNSGLWGLGNYKGDFKNNLRHGKGTFVFYDGSKYIGEWKGDYRDGKGTYICPDGHKVEGKWRKDFLVGLKWNLYGNDLPFTKELQREHIDDIEFTVSGKISKSRSNPKLKYNNNIYMLIDHNEKEFKEKKKK
jgi:hypothetical protein